MSLIFDRPITPLMIMIIQLKTHAAHELWSTLCLYLTKNISCARGFQSPLSEVEDGYPLLSLSSLSAPIVSGPTNLSVAVVPTRSYPIATVIEIY